ncbi:MAG: DinB family protein [Candidatus Promineifilaceae bacterium]|nr:DinB family protein [Candidatus Promineifilaceae bacterium]
MSNESIGLDQLFAHWAQVRAHLLDAIDNFEDADLHYRPFAKAMSAGQIMTHIADAEEGWFRYVITGERSDWPADYTLQNYPSKEAIKQLLDQVHGRTETFLATLELADLERRVQAPWDDATFTLGWIILHVLEHEIHHRGELSLILGLLGREGLAVF